jgi:hypothetical protein
VPDFRALLAFSPNMGNADARNRGWFPQQIQFYARRAARPFIQPRFGRAASFRVALVPSMGHGPAAFKETDVKRAVKAITEAGQPVAGVRFNKDGGFTVVIGKPGETLATNVWDQVLEDPHE